MQTGLPLAIGPFDGLVADFEVHRGGAPADQGEPIPGGVNDHIAELLADQAGILQVMMLADPLVPSPAFGRRDQTDLELPQEALFVDIRQS
jgi:hypothetical protein